MFIPFGADVRSKVAILAILFTISGMALGQDNFMMGFYSSSMGDTVINRGDFNNDGILDVITGNNGGTGGNGVSVNLGIGDGRFRPALNSGHGIGTFDMAIGDFNGDGKLDLALAGYTNSAQGVLQIMLGIGDGTFKMGQKFQLPGIPSSITTADFNGDGKLDLALGMGNIALYQGKGDGTFASVGTVIVGTQNSVGGVRVGDFNADGKPDLAVVNSPTLYALFGAGNFKFSKAIALKTEANGISATPVDVNQDGYTDLLVTYYSCPVGKDEGGNCTNWEILLGTSTERFKQGATATNLGLGVQGFWGTTAVDINGDGINDIVGLSNFYQMLVWMGNPDGTYASTPLTFQLSSNGAGDLVAGDFNRDGKIDFAVTMPGSPSTVGLAALLNATPRATCTPSTISPSVTICEPQDLAYSNSPVQWIADSRDTAHPVTAMQIYVDNKLVVNSPSSSLNERVTMAKGPHFVVTKAWDTSGANFVSDRRVTVYSGTPGETCAASLSSVNVCSPTQNETTSTSVHVFANSYSVALITSVQVYIDNSLVYNDTSGATYVDTAVTVKPGSHSIVVKEWDADGSVYSETRNITAQ